MKELIEFMKENIGFMKELIGIVEELIGLMKKKKLIGFMNALQKYVPT